MNENQQHPTIDFSVIGNFRISEHFSGVPADFEVFDSNGDRIANPSTAQIHAQYAAALEIAWREALTNAGLGLLASGHVMIVPGNPDDIGDDQQAA